MKSNSASRVGLVLPVLFSFFVMGFCDVVGIATNYVQQDFSLSETLAGFIPTMVFFWFLLLSVPAAMLMNRLGRKRTVQLSNVITIIGMLIPFISYDFVTCLVAFAFLGIGNTILQVSLNPLLTNVVSGKTLTSSLTAGQVVKAVSSFLGPFIAAASARWLGSWIYIFPVYAAITALSAVWLLATPIPRELQTATQTSLGRTFALLRNKEILLLFLGIFFVVGIDVGTNTIAPKLLRDRLDIPADLAGFGSSVYFLLRTAGAFIGAFLLARVNDIKYFRINMLAALVALGLLFFATSQTFILILIGCIGFFCSCVFSIIFSAALKAQPENSNGISGLMIMGIFGGAVIPPLMGFLTDLMGSQAGSLLVLSVCALYLVVCSFMLKPAAGPLKA